MDKNRNLRMIMSLMVRLLPVQILAAAVGSINGIVSSYFATNYVGIDAMSAVGLYSPVGFLLGAVSTLLAGGCAILSGQYLGQNRMDRLQSVFALDLVVSTIAALILAAAGFFLGMRDLTGMFTQDAAIRLLFNRYLIGQAIGILPLILGGQMPVFLAIENQRKRTTAASVIYIAVNLVLNLVFVKNMKMEAFGLALASSLGMWVFLLVQLQYFLSDRAVLKPVFRRIAWGESIRVAAVGFPGAASLLYQTVRGLIVNNLLTLHTGSMGLSAFAAANNLLGIFWALPGGILAVSRLLISVSEGEEDRRTLADIIRVVLKCFVPLVLVVDMLIMALSVPLARLFFQDPAVPAFGMMVSCLRILPLCMPLSVICMHFVCYGQSSGKHLYVNLLSLLDGVVCVAGLSYLLTGFLGIRGVCWANVLNGIVTTLFIVGCAWIRQKHFPQNMEELMMIPEEFGVPEEDRIDVSVRTVEEVVDVAQRVQAFCLARGVDEKRAYYAGLSMEEMAGNVVEHGFSKDSRKHTVDLRTSWRRGKVILRIKDDCVPFDPQKRKELSEGEDVTKNIGIRMVYSMADSIEYRNILGLNVLTITI
ncbi:MAG: ATP-binding protein [Solobacterium sp.]|nr:ATP-binding protein [Solobacterium sp.]